MSEYFPSIKRLSSEIREKTETLMLNVISESKYESIEFAHQYEPARNFINYPLIDHINEVVNLVLLFKGLCSKECTDTLIAGALLHDIDKYCRYGSKSSGEIVENLKIPHAIHGAKILKEYNIPTAIVHMVESHSRSFSLVPPETEEAILLRHADELAVELKYRRAGIDIWNVGCGDGILSCMPQRSK